MARKPLVIGIGGSTTPGSSTEQALALALSAARDAGAETKLFGGAILTGLPHYLAHGDRLPDDAVAMIDAVRAADGVIFASPGYHGSISGVVKNAIDYIEETARDERVYLDGLPVGLIATAYGWQATGSTLAALRSIVHALRGWPTPLGGAINTTGGIFKDGVCSEPRFVAQLEEIGRQVFEFALLRMQNRAARPAAA